MSQRYYWLDWAKVIGLYLMVLGHTGGGLFFWGKWLYSFHMPLFFIISGILAPPPHVIVYKMTILRVFCYRGLLR